MRPHQSLLFVYGTLKRGYWNHRPYMDGLRLIDEDARTPGRIMLRRSLTPILDVNVAGSVVHRVGSADHLADLRAVEAAPPQDPGLLAQTVKDWASGELYALAEARGKRVKQLAFIDELEDFSPQRPSQSLYERVLVPVLRSSSPIESAWAWVYRAPSHRPVGQYKPAQNPSCWRGEVELPMHYFKARQQGESIASPPLKQG